MAEDADVRNVVQVRTAYWEDWEIPRNPDEVANIPETAEAPADVRDTHCARGNCACEEEQPERPCTSRCAVMRIPTSHHDSLVLSKGPAKMN